MAVLTSTQYLCYEQKYEKYRIFLFDFFPFLVVKFSIYLNRRVFVMGGQDQPIRNYIIRLSMDSAKHIDEQILRCSLRKYVYSNTVDSRYLELQGTLKNSSRYPYFDISDLQI